METIEAGIEEIQRSFVHDESDTQWRTEALCRGLTEVFFGPASERPERRVEREEFAKSICAACPGLLPCRQFARHNREHGIWGGETDEDRAAMGYVPANASRRSVLAAARNKLSA